MDHMHYLLLGVIVCAVLAVTGCTAATSSNPVAAAVTPASAPTLALLSLTSSDVPAGYVFTSGAEKNVSDIDRLALDLGWQGGYAVTYTNRSAEPGNQDIIVQTITTYPAKNIPRIMGIIVQQESADTAMNYTDMADPGIGEISGGFTGTLRSQKNVNADEREPLMPGLAATGVSRNFAEVYFSKGTTFEVIRMTGPHANTAEVTALARTASAKIP